MTSPSPLIDSKGRPVLLDRQLGSGAEGAVFTLRSDSQRVAKIYHNRPTAEKVQKLTAMIALANQKLLAVSTWPNELLFDPRTRHPAGFAMPRLVDFQEIWHLYHPVERLKSFPRAGWLFQVRAARNLAAAFDEVHGTGCVVGDVQLRNAHVSPKAIVRLVDCDSFQVVANGKQFLCDVGLPHYIPPELQGKPLRGLVRTQNHDRFGLAVLLYQLLFVGRHPYAGVYQGPGDPSFEQLIAEFRFSQGPRAQIWSMSPPPHTPTFADIPPDLAMLFRRAFERGSETGTRPPASEWLPTLKQLEQNIAECPNDPGHTYWRGAGKCVWCRLGQHGGPEYYFGVAGGASTFAVDEARLREILRRLTACQPLELPYERGRFVSGRVPEAEALPGGLESHRNTSIVLGVTIALCLLAVPFGLVHGAICFVGFFGVVVFGIWLAVLQIQSPWHREYRRRRAARNRVRSELYELEDEWERKVRRYHKDHSDLAYSIHRMVRDCGGLATQYQGELQRLSANAEALARVRHLRLHLLADAEIPKIGAGRKQVLAANGISTAADIEGSKIRGIKGFGDALTSNLVTWRDEVLRQFRFNPASAVSPGEQRSLIVQFQARQKQILAKLNLHLADLEALAPRCHGALQKLIPDLKVAVAAYEQADADFRLMKGSRFFAIG